MRLDTNRPLAQRDHAATPDHRREELLNRLCTLREDPRFADWCHLTSALGLGDLPLVGLGTLGTDAAKGLFPELRAGDRADGGDARALPPALHQGEAADRGTAADLMLGTGMLPGLPVVWPDDGPGDGAVAPVPFAIVDDAVFDGRITHLPARNGRVG